MSTMSDRDVIAWARQYGALSAMMGDDDGGKLRRLADLAEKGAEDWQPIATAPDGDVLLCRGAAVGVGHVAGNNVAWQLPGTPTHWRPLPALPGGER
jgi:hypothetical protein